MLENIDWNSFAGGKYHSETQQQNSQQNNLQQTKLKKKISRSKYIFDVGKY